MKRLINIFFLYFIIQGVSAQSWVFVNQYSSASNIFPSGLGVDNADNYYFFGDYKGTVTIHGKSFSNLGGSDLFLVKYDNNGDTLWIRTMGGPLNEVSRAMVTDSDGNCYITGAFQQTLDFNGAILVSEGGEDIFLAKYNAAGVLQWARNVGYGPAQDRASDLTLAPNGDIVMVGFYSDSIMFRNTVNATLNDTLYYNGTTNNFIARFDGNGNFLAVKDIVGDNNGTRINSIRPCLNEGFYISGSNHGTTTLASAHTTNGAIDILFGKTDNSFNFLWSYDFGDTGDDKSFQMEVDNNGDAYVTGSFKFLVNFGGMALQAVANTDFYVTKYNPSGQLLWAKSKGNNYNTIGINLDVDDKTVQVTGTFDDILTFNKDTIYAPSVFGKDNIFIAYYDLEGNEIGAEFVDDSDYGGSNYDRGRRIAIDNEGMTILGGQFRSDSLFFGTSDTLVNMNPGTFDAFITKYTSSFKLVLDKTDALCYGQNDGRIVATPFYGTPPYTYLWSNGDTDSIASGLVAGVYSVMVTDGTLKQITDSVEILEPDIISIQSSNLTHNVCFGDTLGMINVQATGGTVADDYMYSWSNGVTDTSRIEDLASGIYTVTVTDDNGCQQNFDYEILPTKIDVSILSTDATCFGADNGTITISASGGYNDYVFSIDSAKITSISYNFTNLPGDLLYTVIVLDSIPTLDSVCYSDTVLVFIDEPSEVLIDSEVVTDILCHDQTNGTITLTASGGVGNYEYSINGGTDFYDNGGIFTDLSEGTYPVAVKDGNDCVKNGSALVVNNPAQLTFTQEEAIDITCNGLTDGRIELITTGGTGEISYSIDGGTNYFTNGGIFTDLPVGSNYQTVAKDINDCEITGRILEITEPELVSALITKTDISCNDYNDGEIIINASGGVGDYSYSKDNGTNFQKEYIFPDLPGGNYLIAVKDSNDCSQTYGPIIINNPEVIAYVDESTGDISCYGETDGNITVEATGGSEFLIYTLSQGLNIIEENASGIFNSLSPGAYTVKVNDVNHCGDDIPARGFNIAEPDSLIIDSIATEKETPNEMNGTLTVYASGGTPFYSYLLQPVNIIQTDPVFSGLAANDYEVIVTDLNNCSVTGYATIGSAAIEIFDAFSPNGDGYNDVWNIGSVSYYPQCNIRVFNTWGTLVFSSTGYLEPWDGTKNGSLLPSGTYYYIIELGNGEDLYTGTVNILK